MEVDDPERKVLSGSIDGVYSSKNNTIRCRMSIHPTEGIILPPFTL
jgi:hypothetical protein